MGLRPKRFLLAGITTALASFACSAGLPATTPTPSEPPPPTATPLPTHTPTPSPADHLARGEAALFNGDWDAALAAFELAAKSGEGDVA
ncbi:MAG TPA: hypothetical protein VJ160_02575, partial [Anaerolineales bacterium]|nr:hypothetical protein [Anaerolineales bacterium]